MPKAIEYNRTHCSYYCYTPFIISLDRRLIPMALSYLIAAKRATIRCGLQSNCNLVFRINASIKSLLLIIVLSIPDHNGTSFACSVFYAIKISHNLSTAFSA